MKRWIGLCCLLIWLATPVLWWESRQPVPREIVQCDIGERQRGFFSEDGRLFLYGDEQQVRIYDLVERNHVATLPRSIYDALRGGHRGPLGFKRRDRIELVDLGSGKTIRSFAAGPGPLDWVTLAPNDKVAAVHQMNGSFRLWDVDTGQVLLELGLPATFRLVGFSSDSRRVAVMEYPPPDQLKIIDIATLEVTENASAPNCGVGFAADGRLLGLACAPEDDLELWDLTNDRLIFHTRSGIVSILGNGAFCGVSDQSEPPLHSALDWLGVSPKSILRRSVRPEWQLFDTTTGQLLGCFPGGKGADLQLLPDGETLATCSLDDNFITLWDIPPRTAVHPFWLWATLALAVGLTAWWWRLRSKHLRVARRWAVPEGRPTIAHRFSG